MTNYVEEWNRLALDIHATALEKGWWNGLPNPAEKIALMHAELSEALETLRKDPLAKDEHCPSQSNLEVELADVVIRIMDFGVYYGLDIPGALKAKVAYNKTRPYKHGGKNF